MPSEPSFALSLQSWDAAVERLAGKTDVASSLRSKGWERVPLAIRERAFFSAGVERAREVQTIRRALTKAIEGVDRDRVRDDGTPMSYSREDAVADIRAALGAVGDSRRLSDLTSYRRQQLIQDFQSDQAYHYGLWKRDLNEADMLDEFPAWEFIRTAPRKVPRSDWWERWGKAGSAVGWAGASRSRMVALKTSPIWARLSRFGTPYPPFDFGSGMGVRDVAREEAVELGLIDDDWDAKQAGEQALQDFNADVEASIVNLDDETKGWLAKALGDLGRVDAEKVTLRPLSQPQRTAESLRKAVRAAKTVEEAHRALELPTEHRTTWKPIRKPSKKLQPAVDKATGFLERMVHRSRRVSYRVKTHQGRGEFDPVTMTAHIRPDEVGLALHEITHGIEFGDTDILRATRSFLKSRMKAGEVPLPLSRLTGDGRYYSYEVAIEDEWVSKGGTVYSGKVYSHDGSVDNAYATEILTIGVERLYENPMKFAASDPDYFDFVVKTLQDP